MTLAIQPYAATYVPLILHQLPRALFTHLLIFKEHIGAIIHSYNRRAQYFSFEMINNHSLYCHLEWIEDERMEITLTSTTLYLLKGRTVF